MIPSDGEVVNARISKSADLNCAERAKKGKARERKLSMSWEKTSGIKRREEEFNGEESPSKLNESG